MQADIGHSIVSQLCLGTLPAAFFLSENTWPFLICPTLKLSSSTLEVAYRMPILLRIIVLLQCTCSWTMQINVGLYLRLKSWRIGEGPVETEVFQLTPLCFTLYPINLIWFTCMLRVLFSHILDAEVFLKRSSGLTTYSNCFHSS